MTSGQEEIVIEEILNDANEGDELESRIQALVAEVEGNPIDSQEEMLALSTMEILSRLIYQEANKTSKGQNAVSFSVINRLFTNTIMIRRTSTNNLYSVITGSKQYSSITVNEKRYPNAYHPPISEDSVQGERDAWENAKRLAAILYISIEEFGYENKNTGKYERNEKEVEKGNENDYKQVIDFIEQQTDMSGEPIKNEIGMRESFASKEYYNKHLKKAEPLEIGGNIFYKE